MGMPAFSKYDGSGRYIFEEYPSLPSDWADLSNPPHKFYYTITHSRYGVPFGRKVVTNKARWALNFRFITLMMVNSLMSFFSEPFWRFYPDIEIGDYFVVYLESPDDVQPEPQRGGSFNLAFTLAQK